MVKRVVAAIIREGDKFFATQRGYGDFMGYWEFPGGKVEPGESDTQALIREIREELDILVEIEKKAAVVEYDYPRFHLSMSCFFCNIKEGSIVLKEHKDARWLTRETLDCVNWLPADVELIQKLKQPDKRQ